MVLVDSACRGRWQQQSRWPSKERWVGLPSCSACSRQDSPRHNLLTRRLSVPSFFKVSFYLFSAAGWECCWQSSRDLRRAAHGQGEGTQGRLPYQVCLALFSRTYPDISQAIQRLPTSPLSGGCIGGVSLPQRRQTFGPSTSRPLCPSFFPNSVSSAGLIM